MTKILVASILLLLVACSNGPSDATTRSPLGAASQSPADTAGATGPGPDDTVAERRGKKEERRAPGAPGDEAVGGRDDGRRASAGTAPDPEPRVARGGSYLFAQTGWEEFCSDAACDRNDLPSRQRVDVARVARNGDRSVYTTETGGSSRTQTTRYAQTDARLVVERLSSRLEYQGFAYETEIDPDRPIVALKLPVRVGARWSGRWTNRSPGPDGSYSVEIIDKQPSSARGRKEMIYVVRLGFELTGDLEGTIDMKVWISDRDLMALSSKGDVDLESSYGTYRSSFTTAYQSGP